MPLASPSLCPDESVINCRQSKTGPRTQTGASPKENFDTVACVTLLWPFKLNPPPKTHRHSQTPIFMTSFKVGFLAAILQKIFFKSFQQDLVLHQEINAFCSSETLFCWIPKFASNVFFEKGKIYLLIFCVRSLWLAPPSCTWKNKQINRVMSGLTLPLESHWLPQLPSVVTNHSQDKPCTARAPFQNTPDSLCLSTSDQVLCHGLLTMTKDTGEWWDSAKASHTHLPKVTSSRGKAHCPHPQHPGYNSQHFFASAC